MKSVGVSQSISDQQGRKLEEKGVADTNRTTKVFRSACVCLSYSVTEEKIFEAERKIEPVIS